MRCVVVLVTILAFTSTYAATPKTKQAQLPTIEELDIEINRNPDAIEPKIEISKRLITKGDKLGAHAYLSEVLNRSPDSIDAQKMMKEILLSDEPFLGNRGAPVIETKFFKIPHIPKQYEFVKNIQIDAFGERLRKLTNDSTINNKILVILYDSDESFMVASSGRRRSFASMSPKIIGIDPNLDRDQFVEAFKEALVELWVKTNIPKTDLPPGIRFGLAHALSPILTRPKNIKPMAITDLLEEPPKNAQMLYSTTLFLNMLHELNPDGFPSWLKTFGTDINPMNELLKTFHFTNWSDVHSTFKDYLRKNKG